MTSVSLEVCVRTISISGAKEMDRTMLPDSLGDNHQKITEDNQLDIYDKIFYACKNH